METARQTLDKTTQVAVRNFTDSMGGGRLKPIHYQLKYWRLRCEMFVDTYIVKCKSPRDNKVATVYCTPFHWIRFDPTPGKADAHNTLDSLFQTVGIPSALIPDNAKELTTKVNSGRRPQGHLAPHTLLNHTHQTQIYVRME